MASVTRTINGNGALELDFNAHEFNRDLAIQLKNLENLNEETIQNAIRVFFTGAEQVLGDSMADAPLDKGFLRGSGFVGTKETDIIAETISVSRNAHVHRRIQNYGKIPFKKFKNGEITAVIGYNKSYAAKMELHKGKFSDSTAKPNFLSRNLHALAPHIFDEIKLQLHNRRG